MSGTVQAFYSRRDPGTEIFLHAQDVTLSHAFSKHFNKMSESTPSQDNKDPDRRVVIEVGVPRDPSDETSKNFRSPRPT